MATATFVIVGLGLSVVTQTLRVESADEAVTPNYGPVYQFKYHVHDLMTMDYKTHEEIGENGSVRGTYTVREPNGDLRVVSYTAGDSRGFQAMVRVRPTSIPPEAQVSEQPQGTKSIAMNIKQAKGSDSPLRIQLDTGRGVDHPQHREQRQSKSEGDKKNSTSVLTAAAPETVIRDKVQGNTSTITQVQNITSERKPQFADSGNGSNQYTKKQTGDPTKYKTFAPKTRWPESYYKLKELRGKSSKVMKPTILPMTVKIKPLLHLVEEKDPHNTPKLAVNPELAAAYLPYHISNVQNIPHFGHFIAPVFLHVLPPQPSNRATLTVNTPVVHCSTQPSPEESKLS